MSLLLQKAFDITSTKISEEFIVYVVYFEEGDMSSSVTIKLLVSCICHCTRSVCWTSVAAAFLSLPGAGSLT